MRFSGSALRPEAPCRSRIRGVSPESGSARCWANTTPSEGRSCYGWRVIPLDEGRTVDAACFRGTMTQLGPSLLNGNPGCFGRRWSPHPRRPFHHRIEHLCWTGGVEGGRLTGGGAAYKVQPPTKLGGLGSSEGRLLLLCW